MEAQQQPFLTRARAGAICRRFISIFNHDGLADKDDLAHILQCEIYLGIPVVQYLVGR